MSSPSANGRHPEEPETEENAPYTVVMVRHGQSEANVRAPKTFSGWEDAPLTCLGKEQAKRVGRELKDAGFKFDVGYTSLLSRAERTLNLILEEMGQADIPRYRTWRLNERHFGAIHGLNRNEIIQRYGDDMLNPFNTPPPMTEDHPHYTAIREHAAGHEEAPAPHEFPRSESLRHTIERTVPYWHDVIVPQLLNGKNVIIVGHSINLKGLAMYLDSEFALSDVGCQNDMSSSSYMEILLRIQSVHFKVWAVDAITDLGKDIPDEDVDKIAIPNAKPFIYKFDKNMKPVVSMKYLNEAEMFPQ